jgi:dTDP-4-dehydrorhamnose reductase
MKQNIKVFLTGAAGQLGNAIQAVSKTESQIQLHCYSHTDLDIRKAEQLNTCIANHKPDILINCAAYTAVDKAESERKDAFEINTLGAENLARMANQFNSMLIHLSTDYVFPGTLNFPRLESDVTNPINYYGVTKRLAEEAIGQLCEQYVILRVSGVFSEYGHNFLKTICRLANTKNQIRVVDDQITCPTYAGDIAEAIIAMIKHTKKKYGIYHYTNKSPVSWYNFAKAIIYNASMENKMFADKNHPVTLSPIASIDYPTPAKRPLYAVLNCDKILRDYGIEQREWQIGITQSLRALAKY